jgi:hypothetical protein
VHAPGDRACAGRGFMPPSAVFGSTSSGFELTGAESNLTGTESKLTGRGFMPPGGGFGSTGTESNLTGTESKSMGAESKLMGAESKLTGRGFMPPGGGFGSTGAESKLTGTESDLMGAGCELTGYGFMPPSAGFGSTSAESKLRSAESKLTGTESKLTCPGTPTRRAKNVAGTMGRLRQLVLGAIGSLVAGSPLVAHHAWPVDSAKPITLHGTVTAFTWRNPHVMIALDVDANGSVEKWTVGGSSPQFMTTCGWSKKSLKAGDVITVIGYRFRDGSATARMRTTLMPGGKEMFYGAPPGQAPECVRQAAEAAVSD